MGEEHTDLCCQATNDSFFFLPQKRETMIKNSSVAWQASGWFAANVGGQEGAGLAQSLCLTDFLGLGSVLYPSSEERGDIDLCKE